MSGNFSIKVVVIAAIFILLGIAGFLVPEKSVQSQRYFLKNKAGAVIFDHQYHSEQTEECANCHHPLLLSAEKNICETCHDPDMSPEYFDHDNFLEIPDHSCTSCHSVRDEVAPQNCRDCHQKSQESNQYFLGCITCHDESYDQSDFSHDDLLTIHDSGCDGCHSTRSLDEAYHRQCNRCHLTVAEKKYTQEGQIKCNVCHLK